MKKTIFILLCWFSFANAQQTLFRVDCNDGNDSNDGTTWPGFLTLTAAEADADFGAADTLVSTGTCTETFSPSKDGTSGNKIYWLDSLVVADGWNPAQIDTAKVWSTIVDGGATRNTGVSVSGDDFRTINGIRFKDCLINNIFLGGKDNLVTQCKSSDHGDGGGQLINVQSDGRDSVITNLFLGDVTVQYAMFMLSSTGDNVVQNNTMYGDFSVTDVRLDGSGTLIKWQNNLLQNTSTSSGDLVARLDIGSTGIIAGAWDFNLYWEATAITNAFSFNGATFDVISVWVDSVDNYLSGSEANALNSDPLLQNVATTCSITDSSPAFEAGTNVGYGDDIGYFQIVSSAARRRIPSRVF